MGEGEEANVGGAAILCGAADPRRRGFSTYESAAAGRRRHTEATQEPEFRRDGPAEAGPYVCSAVIPSREDGEEPPAWNGRSPHTRCATCSGFHAGGPSPSSRLRMTRGYSDRAQKLPCRLAKLIRPLV